MNDILRRHGLTKPRRKRRRAPLPVTAPGDLARQLTRITCDLDLGVEAEGLRRRRPDTQALGGLYDQLGFGPFLRRQGDRLAQMPLA